MSLGDVERALLCEVLEHLRTQGSFPQVQPFRLGHERQRQVIDALEEQGFLRKERGGNEYWLTLKGLLVCGSESARHEIETRDTVIETLKDAYRAEPDRTWTVEEISQRAGRDVKEVARALTFLSMFSVPGIWSSLSSDEATGFVSRIRLSEGILDAEPPGGPAYEGPDEEVESQEIAPRIESMEISGYRPFEKFSASPGNLTVVIGANATGKSSVFDFLRFVSFAASNPLPPEIDPGSAGKRLFHAGGPERIAFALVVDLDQKKPLRYEVEIRGPVGSPRVAREHLATTEPLAADAREPFVFLDFRGGKGVVRDQVERKLKRPQWTVQANELALRRALDPTLATLTRFQSFVSSWRFYSGFDIAGGAIRRPVPTEPDPTLSEDGANLSAVLLSLVTRHADAWQELETHLRSVVPGFLGLGVEPRGGPGTVIGIWREAGVKDALTFADLSDGILRFLCWATLCLAPSIPPLMCIDEPELGLHPRMLPVLAGLLRLASARSQILVATHCPYFLSQFSLDEIAVMRKDGGRAVFVRPGTSKALRREIEEMGSEALARLHISDELEVRT